MNKQIYAIFYGQNASEFAGLTEKLADAKAICAAGNRLGLINPDYENWRYSRIDFNCAQVPNFPTIYASMNLYTKKIWTTTCASDDMFPPDGKIVGGKFMILDRDLRFSVPIDFAPYETREQLHAALRQHAKKLMEGLEND